MALIYLLFVIHFLSGVFSRKKPINIFTLLNLILIISFADFFIIKKMNYENYEILIVTFLFTYFSACIFDYYLKYENLNIQNKKVSQYFEKIYIIVLIFRIASFVTNSLYGTHSGTSLEVTSYSNILGVLNNSGIYFYITAVILKNQKKIISTGIIESIWFLISGSKLFVVFVILIYLFNKYQHQKVSKIIVGYIALSIIVLPYFFLIASNFRISTLTGRELNYDNVKDIILLDNQIISEIEYDEIILRFSTAYFYDKFVTYSIINPHNKFSSGDHFIISFLWFIPKAIWKDKPPVSYGSWIGEEIYDWRHSSRSEAAPTLWGDFYNSFGLLGVFIGVLLFHSILLLLFNIVLKNTFFKAFFTLAILSRVLFIYEQNFSSSIVFIMSTIFISFFIQKILIKNVHISYNNIQ